MYVNINTDSPDYFDVDTLIKYDLDTGEQELLFESVYDVSAMQGTSVNQKWLTWIDSTMDGYEEKIHVMSLETNEIRTLSETNPEYLTILSPILYEDYVAWTELNEEKMKVEVKLHNLVDNQTATIAVMESYTMMNAKLHFEDGVLLWTDTRGEKGYYFLYDIETETTESYESPFQYEGGYATLSNGRIFSLNLNEDQNWTVQNFGYYDIESGAFHQLIFGDYINYFATYGNQLVVLDNRNTLHYQEYIDEEWVAIDLDFVSDEVIDIVSFDSQGHLIMPLVREQGEKQKVAILPPIN